VFFELLASSKQIDWVFECTWSSLFVSIDEYSIDKYLTNQNAAFPDEAGPIPNKYFFHLRCFERIINDHFKYLYLSIFDLLISLQIFSAGRFFRDFSNFSDFYFNATHKDGSWVNRYFCTLITPRDRLCTMF